MAHPRSLVPHFALLHDLQILYNNEMCFLLLYQSLFHCFTVCRRRPIRTYFIIPQILEYFALGLVHVVGQMWAGESCWVALRRRAAAAHAHLRHTYVGMLAAATNTAAIGNLAHGCCADLFCFTPVYHAHALSIPTTYEYTRPNLLHPRATRISFSRSTHIIA